MFVRFVINRLSSYYDKISENYIYIIHFFVVPHITLGKVYKGGQNGKKILFYKDDLENFGNPSTKTVA